jgi:hypothetical protein
MESHIDEYQEYRRELVSALDTLGPEIESGHIGGEGAAQFLYAYKGDRGVELYRGDGGVIIDPAFGEELQGEIRFCCYEAAVEAALRWLKGCSHEELFAEGNF